MNVPALRFKDDVGHDYPEWEVRTLEQLASVERGKFSVRPRNDPKYFGGTIPFVQTGDVVFADLFLNRFSQTLNDEGLKVSRLFPKNTVLITIAANIGDTAITKFDVACTDSVVAIQPFNKIANHVWLKFSLDTKKDELDSKATQNAQKNINLQILKPLLFNTPTFQEQIKIANFLSAVDEKILQLTQKHDLLTQYKKGVMQQIFSQELRFKDDDGKDFHDWEELAISDLFQRSTYSSKTEYIVSDGKYIIVDMGSVSRDAKLLSTKRADFANDFLTTSDLVMVKDDIGGGNIIGRVVKIPENNKYICSDHVYKLSIKNGCVTYFYYAINSFSVNKCFRQKANGTAQIGISNKTVDEQLLPVPSFPEQTKIANFLTAIDDKITATQTQLKAVKQYKQGLLQQMFV